MFKIKLSKKAIKSLESLDGKSQERVYKGLEIIKRTPFWHRKIKKLHGPLKGNYRYRTSGLRIIYTVDTPANTVLIIEIAKRGRAYRGKS